MSKFHQRARANRTRKLSFLEEEVVSLFDYSLLKRAREVLYKVKIKRAANPAANSVIIGLRDAELLAECIVKAARSCASMDNLSEKNTEDQNA